MAALLRAGEVSSRELTEAHLAAAERDNRGAQRLAVDRPRAGARRGRRRRRAARRGPGGRRRARSTALHPLLGIPVALKDLVSVKGGQCTAGSRILEGYRAPYDAHITERLRDAGAVILGKTNMDEFAMGSSTEHSAYGPTANPWALDRVPGGSSGGSAAAVAAYHAPAVDRHGHRRLDPPAGGAVRDRRDEADLRPGQPLRDRRVRLARSTRSGRSPATPATPRRCSTRSPAATTATRPRRRRRSRTRSCRSPRRDDEAAAALRGKRLGLPREYFVAGMEPGVEARVREAVAALEAAGAIVEEVSLPHTDYGLATYYIVAPAEASANLARYDGIRFGPRLGDGDVLADYLATRGQGFGAEVKRRIMLGTYALSAGYYDAYYLKAQKVRTLIKGDFDALWAQGFDALVAPTCRRSRSASARGMADPVSMYLSDACTLPVNMAGLPGDLHPVRAVGGAAGRAPAHRRAVVRGGAVRARARLRGDHRRRRLAAASSRPTSRPPATRPRRRRPSAWPRAGADVRPRSRDSGRTALGRAARRRAHHAIGGDVCVCASRSPARSSGPPPGSPSSRAGRWWRTWGIDPDEATKAAARRRPRPDADRDRDPRDHDRRAARGGLAVARPDGLRAGRLVQLRPARQARQERRRDRPGAGRRSTVGDIVPTAPGRRVRGRRRRARPGPRPVARTRRSSRRRPSAAEAAKADRGRTADERPGRARGVGRDPAARPRRTSRRAGRSSSSRSTAAGRGSSSASGSGSASRARRSASSMPVVGLRRVRDDAAPDARHPRPRRALTAVAPARRRRRPVAAATAGEPTATGERPRRADAETSRSSRRRPSADGSATGGGSRTAARMP